jgi:hypothetical protein
MTAIDEKVREALAWYGEQARLARLIHREGDAGRHALAADGGKRARAALENGPAGLADATSNPSLSDLSSLRKGAEVAALAIWNSKLLQPARGPWDGTNSATWQCCMSAAHDVLAAFLANRRAGL